MAPGLDGQAGAAGAVSAVTSELNQKFCARFWLFNITLNQENQIQKIRISCFPLSG
jgi:hypothetical protein